MPLSDIDILNPSLNPLKKLETVPETSPPSDSAFYKNVLTLPIPSRISSDKRPHKFFS